MNVHIWDSKNMGHSTPERTKNVTSVKPLDTRMGSPKNLEPPKNLKPPKNMEPPKNLGPPKNQKIWDHLGYPVHPSSRESRTFSPSSIRNIWSIHHLKPSRESGIRDLQLILQQSRCNDMFNEHSTSSTLSTCHITFLVNMPHHLTYQHATSFSIWI
jgi:hypothetical protein